MTINPGYERPAHTSRMTRDAAVCLGLPTFGYDTALGARISRDPIAEQGGLNLYAYVENNLVNLTDPLGLLALNLSVGVGVTAFVGAMGIHYEGNLGVSIDIFHPSNTRGFANFQQDGMVGYGAFIGVGAQRSMGLSRDVPCSGVSDPIDHVHGEAGSAWGPGAGGSVDISRNGAAGSVGIRPSIGAGAYGGLGTGSTATAVSPSVGSLLGWH